MTPDKTPSELDAFIETHMPAYWQYGATEQDRLRSLVQAALAKWGSPVVAGESVAWESTVPGYIKHITQSQYERFSVTAQRGYKPFKCLSCTTPQPTQAQAGAVPLTHDEALDAFCHTPGIHQFVQAFMAGVRFAEQHHGIKGGQHGTE